MNKYFTTLTNERGDVLPNYRTQVVDGAGSTVTIYADSSGTRFTDASGNIINYATASANGRVSFYFTAADGQVLQTLDSAGDLVDSEADFADNFVLGNLSGDIAQSAVTDLTTDLAAKVATATLAASGGSASVGFLQSGTGAVARTLQDKGRDAVSVKDFGATGDGVTADTAAINALISEVGNYGGDLGEAGYISSGLYVLDATLPTDSYTWLYGDGPHQSVLRNDVVAIPTIPAFTAAGALIFSTFENIGARGQKSFIDVTGTTDGNNFRNVIAGGMADAGFRFRGMLQTSIFDNVSIENAANGPSVKGIVSETAVANRITLHDVSFKNLTDDHVTLAGSEDFMVFGPRHEGTVAAGKAAYRLTGANYINVFGGYLEGGAEYDVAWTGTPDGLVAFNGTHWTYYTVGVPHLTSVAAGGQLAFTNCHSTEAKTVPGGSMMMGINTNIQVEQGGASFAKYGPRGGQADLKGVKGTGTTLDADFLTFTRPSAAAVATNQQAVSGKLRLTLSGYTGGFPQSLVKTYDILIEGKTSFNVTLGQTVIGTVDNSAGAFGFTITGVSQTTTAITLHVQATGLQGAVEAIVSASFEWTGHSYTEGDEFVVTAP